MSNYRWLMLSGLVFALSACVQVSGTPNQPISNPSTQVAIPGIPEHSGGSGGNYSDDEGNNQAHPSFDELGSADTDGGTTDGEPPFQPHNTVKAPGSRDEEPDEDDEITRLPHFAFTVVTYQGDPEEFEEAEDGIDEEEADEFAAEAEFEEDFPTEDEPEDPYFD